MRTPSGLVARWSPTTAGGGFIPDPRPSPRERVWARRLKQTTRLATGERRGDGGPLIVGASFCFASAAFALDRVSTQGDKTSRRETPRGKRPRVETGGRRHPSPIASDAHRRRRGGDLHRTTAALRWGEGGSLRTVDRSRSSDVVYATDLRRCAIRSTLRRSRVHGESEREARSDHRRNQQEMT